MCGIAGLIYFDGRPVRENELARMTGALAHRGPDGQGVRVDGSVGLGHRRLSIIDLDGGAQPMSNEDGRIWVTFNGEIYNYVELQRVLESKGHQFRTSCDTEVIVHAYEEWGESCVQLFRGMFAFAIHDTRRNEVFLARDRLGVKPLLYSIEPHRVAFASELQALEAIPDSNWCVRLDAIGFFMRLQYIPAPHTIYHNVFKLLPGHTLRVDLNRGRVLPIQRYWDIQFQPDAAISENEWCEQLESTLRDATRLRLRSDVPFGAFLSGGVDSSLVVAYMSELLEEPVRTFCIGFDEQEFSEVSYARQAAQICQTQHFEELVRVDALEILPHLVRNYGEPFGDSSAVPTYYVSRLARQHVKMVLSGDGGDENFAGYSQYKNALLRQDISYFSRQQKLKRLAGNVARQVGLLPSLSQPLDVWKLTAMTTDDTDWLRLTENRALGLVSHGAVPSSLLKSYRSRNIEYSKWDFYHWVQYFDLKNYLPDSILAKVDIASMSCGLEVRAPLLDHHVAELAARIPSKYKIGFNERSEPEGKLILKKVAERFYSRDFLSRPKMGFSVPLRHWFKGTTLRDLESRLLDSESRLGELFNEDGIRYLVQGQEHEGHKFSSLWQLLWLSEWFHQHPSVSIK